MKKEILKTAHRKLRKGIARLGDERGISLVESLVAVAILGFALVVFLSALSTGSMAVGTVNEQVTAQNLARSQLESTESQDYLTAPANYDTITSPAGFTVSAEASSIPGAGDDIQKITITVYRDGQAILVVEDYKVNR